MITYDIVVAVAAAASIGCIIGMTVGASAIALAQRHGHAPAPPTAPPDVPAPTPPPGPAAPLVRGAEPLEAHPVTGRPTIGRAELERVKGMAARIREALSADADAENNIEIKPAVNALGDVLVMLLGHYAASVDPEEQSTAMVRQTVDEIFEQAVHVAFKERYARQQAQPQAAPVAAAKGVH